MTPGRRRTGDRLDKYVLRDKLGEGGSGVVWKATDDQGAEWALKILDVTRPRPGHVLYLRFRNEVERVREFAELPGILPITDYHLPESFGKNGVAYFTMPIARPLRSRLDSREIPDVVRAFADLADTLAELARRGVSHRDIKPENLYWYR